MTSSSTSTESTSRERVARYRALAHAFSYPDGSFSGLWPQLDRREAERDYDRLFRTGRVWLYGAEHLARHEFQRTRILTDIMGFYRAFGVQPDRERADALAAELEFMHLLIAKRLHARGLPDGEEKEAVCLDAEKKFFTEHLLPAGERIALRIIEEEAEGFYPDAARELLSFLRDEQKLYGGAP